MATLTIEFKGQDGVGSIVNNISAEFNTLNQTTNEAKASGQGFFSGMLSSAAGFLSANLIGNIAGQVKDFIGGGIEDAKQANLLMAQTEAVLTSTGNAAGVTAQHVADYASSLSAASGQSLFGDDQIQQSENLILTFTNIKGKVVDAATAVSVDMAQALGGAPKDAAIMLGKALNDPEKGITALTKSGVTFTEQQKLQIKALQDSGDMAGAQSIIIAELNKEFGGSAAAAAKADGGIAQLKDQMGEMAEGLGQAVLPIIKQFTSFLASNVMPVVVDLAEKFADNLPVAIGIVTQAWADLQPTIQPVIDIITRAVASFGESDTAATQMGTVITALKADWQTLAPVVTNVVNAVGQVIQAVFGVVQTFIQAHGADIKAFMLDAWTQIQDIIKLAIQLYNAVVPPVLRAIAGFIRDHGDQIQAVLGAAWNAIKAAIDIALTLIKGVITVALDLIKGDWSGAWEAIKEMSARIVGDLITIITSNLEILKTIFGGAIKWIQDEWSALPQQLANVGSAIVNAIKGGFESAWEDFKASMLRKLKDLRDQLPFSEPKDSSSPLYGLSKSGSAIVGNLQTGIDSAPKLAIGGALALGNARVSSGGASGSGGRDGRDGAQTVRIIIDDKSREIKKLVRVEATGVTEKSGAKALDRILTGN